MTGPVEIRDYSVVYAEQVDAFKVAVDAATGAANSEQLAEGSWLNGGLPSGNVWTPVPLEPGPSVVVEPVEPVEAPGL